MDSDTVDTKERAAGVKRSVISEILEKGGTPRPDAADGGPRPDRPKPPPPEPEAGAGLDSFDPDSTDYKAFGWAGKVTLPAFSLILKDGTAMGINYADVATAHPGGSLFLPSAPGCKGNIIRLRITGDGGSFMIIFEGCRLWRGWELLMGHKTPWVRELPQGMEFVGTKEPVIWSVTFDEPPRPAGGGKGR